jgi:hypothetical protein
MTRRIGLLALLGLSACATGRPYEEADVGRFRVGVLTRTDAERLLGPPRYLADLGGGRVKVVWNLGQEGQTASASAARMVSLVFGADGRLAQPPVVSSGSSALEPAPGERPLQPVPTKPCEGNADCAGGVCVNGSCRS